jgi:2-methylisocitrate lyase-like PEP mutase family enzyme
MTTVSDKAEKFLEQHHSGELLLLANAWDVASARMIEAAGFSALATTSAGIGYANGFPDLHRMSKGSMLAAVAQIIAAVDIPVTVDIENGYGETPEDVGETVRQLIGMGVVGCNIEDVSSAFDGTLEDKNLIVQRLHAARQAANAEGVDLVINARTDGYLVGGTGLATFSEAVARGNAYLESGARSVFVPGLCAENEILEMVKEISGPLNLLTVPGLPVLPRLQELGVARVSTGSSLARAAYGSLKGALRELGGAGTYSYTQYAVSFDEMDDLFK